MLLIHQTGSVRVGEVVRYTITYTPAADTANPIPRELFVKVKNTSAIPLRAAYLHGPYTLYTSCYPSTFDPNVKLDQQATEGIPQFEPYLKAGGSWNAVITVPRRLCHKPDVASTEPRSDQKITWIIEIVSQVVFSSTASVNFELLVGRDQKSVELISSGGASTGLQAAQLSDHWSPDTKGKQVIATNGVYSRSITLQIDDTLSLWNTPIFPSSDKSCGLETDKELSEASSINNAETSARSGEPADKPQSNRRRKKIHLVVLTHGLHSNLGADMLYLKESIDIAARKAKEQARNARQKHKCEQSDNYDDDEEEQVVVRGFPGNAVRTERGIQYLGKRLAKYVLLMTYPEQSCNPCHGAKAKPLPKSLALWRNAAGEFSTDHTTSAPGPTGGGHPYRVTSISFIGHSLGGLIQTYAIAYIQKHSPEFFDVVRAVNFVALATPFLGLSNENPMYVRFALDLGLVGRTGQDLGLSWTAPRVRSGWEAIIGGKGNPAKPQGQSDAGSKPLLRILPCGPAHEVLAKFQHRTVYSNVVNDGIVPLRTSCLLFLDWRGLERVEKARRENGIVGTMAEWGWAELTGANSKSPRTARSGTEPDWKDTEEEINKAQKDIPTTQIPSHRATVPSSTPISHQPSDQSQHSIWPNTTIDAAPNDSPPVTNGPLSNIFSIFRPKEPVKISQGHKQTKMLKRSQTLGTSGGAIQELSSPCAPSHESFPDSQLSDDHGLYAPPKTTLFESASDLLMPPLPPIDFIIDPTSRPRTIFHDRVYGPEDIPPPLTPKRRTLTFGSSQSKASKTGPSSSDESSHRGLNENESGLKVEEKIARAYHRDLTWRKVLVRLEPDAHNNIIVRRMFTNAYGWPVVKHLVDTHFGYTYVAQSKDNSARGVERAKPLAVPTNSLGEEVQGQGEPPIDNSASARGLPDSPIAEVDSTDQTRSSLPISRKVG
ncbi:putative serine esterase-domain-containing protein [Aspergillus bertholletiae]|uniref:Putative serine esterase-domain-containing protein n=1 Tax=Aspergillus bertholletiae TaxID=1226010 RepID=A0A5N7B7F8_9EURO|nr:putative serine esterase-domain-containing protein [Aspergillus bertholletiae]